MAEFDPTDYGGGGGGGGDQADGFSDLLGLEEGGSDPSSNEPAVLRDAVLFVIDVSFAAVLQPLVPGGRTAVAEALSAAASVLKTKVITSPDDRVGVVLYGVREQQNPNSFQGIRVIQELDRPSAQRIRQLEQEVLRSPAQFEERYGPKQAVPLSDVLWTCTTIFNLNANPKYFQPRLFLFTGNDSPCATAAEQDAAETRAQDLLDLGVEVEFFPLTPPGSTFSIERFWGRVLPVDVEDHVAQAAVRVEELERRVRRRVHRKRNLQRLTFELAPGADIAVGIYAHCIQAKIPMPVYLLNENNKPLKSETKLLCEQTGGILHPVDDVETFVELGGQRVYISRAEMDDTKRFAEPGLKLLGFKPASKLQSHHRIFHSYFLYPNERAVTGSAALCGALIERMIEKKLMALIRYIPRKNSVPLLAALLPQAESEDSGADQLRPPGFNMVLLPYADDIRSLVFPVPEGVQVTSEMVEKARAVVNALRVDGFAPGCVENPVLQRHYAAVQALALGENQPEETPDLLQPDARALAEKAPILASWRSSIDDAVAAFGGGAAMRAARQFPAMGIDGYEASGVGMPCPPARRNYGAAAESFDPEGVPRPKRQRYEQASLSLQVPTPAEMREHVFTGQVERLTVAVLKEYLQLQGVATSGKKNDLVERVRACI
mmetsp:Transcript_45290/g.80399  ORF Transcript_45290/g.80399 Transcript_45290/m.80399 type:complete len:662 (-) Transcript_45290:98-2083(-)